MSKRTILAAFVGFGLCASVAAAQTPAAPAPDSNPPTVNQRLENQKDRIQAGTADGQLTKGERAKLSAHDRAIRAQALAERKANGGTLTEAEKRQLNRELNRNSRKIRRDRHNDQTPKP